MVDLTARPLRVAAVQVLEVCDSSEAVLGVLGFREDVDLASHSLLRT
jgi:hypothetical protein